MKKITTICMTFIICVSVLISGIGVVHADAGDDNYAGTSNFTNLIVFARFADESEFIDDIYSGNAVKKIIDNSYNSAEYNVGDYYKCASDGKMRMNSVYIYNNGGSVQLPHERGYYAEYSDENPTGYKNERERALRMYDLRVDWSDAVNKAIADGNPVTNYDGTVQYDYSELDKNGDGYIDAITVLYKNTTQDISVGWASPLWDYQEYADYIEVNVGKKKLTSRYYVQLTNSYDNLYRDSKGNLIVPFGKAVHEMGHITGLMDLYNSSSVSPVYYMSVMGKPITQVPQFMSIKEKEALGWLDSDRLKTLTADGDYSINASGTGSSSDVEGYKVDIPDTDKTLYIEYRNFGSDGNKYDSQTKTLNKMDGNPVDGINLKSGLVCYLASTGRRFPNNMNLNSSKWDYEVVGGTQGTKSDAALGVGETLQIKDKFTVKVISIEGNTLTFHIEGEYPAHTHSGGEATCTKKAVCEVCGKEYGEINPDNHAHTELRGEKKATYDQEGYTGDVYCIECQKCIENGVVIERLSSSEKPGEPGNPEKPGKPSTPTITEGNNLVINKKSYGENETAKVSFRSDAPYAQFVQVEYDGMVLVRERDYTVREGSTIVTLTPEFIKTLSAGSHTISIVSQGGTATAYFTVQESDSGNQGGSGSQGNQGNQGGSGEQGSSGNQGGSGEQGSSGNQGGSGSQGSSGNQNDMEIKSEMVDSGNIGTTVSSNSSTTMVKYDNSSPKTGDNNGVKLYVMGMLILAVMAVFSVNSWKMWHSSRKSL